MSSANNAPTLYWFPFSHHARLPYYYALAADIPLNLVVVNLLAGEHKKPDYIKLNPNGQVPTYVEGDLHIWESGTILKHLGRKKKSNLYPLHDPNLLSRIENAYEQVRLKPWLSSLDALLELVVKEQFFKVKADKHIGEVGLKTLPGHLRTVDEYFFKESPHHMVGTELSIADIQLSCLLAQLELIKFDIAAFPAINKFWVHIQTTPLFQAAHKDYYAALVATGVRK